MMYVSNEPFIRIVNIHKNFGQVQALKGISLDIYSGEILGLLGENGAGKTTLMNILFGLYKPDAGEIYVEGEKKFFRSPSDAIKSGIFMVHQHFKLVKGYTAFENIIMGSEQARKTYSPRWREKLRPLVESMIATYGIRINLDSRVEQLSLGEQQRVEILRALFRGAKLLILDEPTTNISPQDIEILEKILMSLKKAGISIIFVSHKLREVVSISDRIAVLRKGELIKIFRRGEYEERSLLEAMFGNIVEALSDNEYKYSINPHETDREILLELRDLSCDPGDGGVQVRDVNLLIYKGEILGIAGVAGNGQKELAECIIGLRKVLKGSIIAFGEDITHIDHRERMRKGMFYIPEDRLAEGLLPSMSVAENMILGIHRKIFKGFFLDNSKINEMAQKMIETLGIKTSSPLAAAGSLSGGNIQKTLIARAIAAKPKILIAHNITRGLDILTTRSVHRILREMCNEGTAIILISDDLDEVLQISHRVSIIYKGRLSIPLRSEMLDREKAVMLMTGIENT
jgi:simple sugar transport system ATP-binding protein